MAWLNATPEGLKESRLDFFRRNLKRDPDFPDTNGCEYLLEYFFSIGVGRSSGMGFMAIEWQEIDAWCRRKKLNLTGWESETIFMLSSAYVSQSAISKQKASLPPYSSTAEAEDKKENVSKGILKAFESLSSKSKKSPQQKRGKKAEG